MLPRCVLGGRDSTWTEAKRVRERPRFSNAWPSRFLSSLQPAPPPSATGRGMRADEKECDGTKKENEKGRGGGGRDARLLKPGRSSPARIVSIRLRRCGCERLRPCPPHKRPSSQRQREPPRQLHKSARAALRSSAKRAETWPKLMRERVRALAPSTVMAMGMPR